MADSRHDKTGRKKRLPRQWLIRSKIRKKKAFVVGPSEFLNLPNNALLCGNAFCTCAVWQNDEGEERKEMHTGDRVLLSRFLSLSLYACVPMDTLLLPPLMDNSNSSHQDHQSRTQRNRTFFPLQRNKDHFLSSSSVRVQFCFCVPLVSCHWFLFWSCLFFFTNPLFSFGGHARWQSPVILSVSWVSDCCLSV